MFVLSYRLFAVSPVGTCEVRTLTRSSVPPRFTAGRREVTETWTLPEVLPIKREAGA